MLPSLNELDRGCVLILGGAKSGKSGLALRLCNEFQGKKVFLATAKALDREMALRIERHKKERPSDWETIEEPLDLANVLAALDHDRIVVIVDCLTLWLNNLLMEYGDDTEAIERDIVRFLDALEGIENLVAVLVSNEVGSGIVPENPLARRFRDLAGSLNQRVASISRKVIMVWAAIPSMIKDQ